MKNKLLLIFLISGMVFGQYSETDLTCKAKIKDLSFLVGNWKGTGWIFGKEGKSEFAQTEKVQFKLDSTAILIEGKGKVGEKIIHNALAILTHNKEDSNYSFRSYLPSGLNSDFKGEFIDNKFYWYPNENVRYIIWLNENRQWYEKGEINRGGNWSQFFEMVLDQVK